MHVKNSFDAYEKQLSDHNAMETIKANEIDKVQLREDKGVRNDHTDYGNLGLKFMRK